MPPPLRRRRRRLPRSVRRAVAQPLEYAGFVEGGDELRLSPLGSFEIDIGTIFCAASAATPPAPTAPRAAEEAQEIGGDDLDLAREQLLRVTRQRCVDRKVELGELLFADRAARGQMLWIEGVVESGDTSSIERHESA
jgi:hypothetical protein